MPQDRLLGGSPGEMLYATQAVCSSSCSSAYSPSSGSEPSSVEDATGLSDGVASKRLGGAGSAGAGAEVGAFQQMAKPGELGYASAGPGTSV